MTYRASKLILKDVNTKEEREFLNNNHYQGYVRSCWCKGLYDGEDLICLMSFGIPRYNKRYDYELLRLCTRKGDNVHGGASKLLKAFKKELSASTSIISYCNESKFTGKVYESLGFEKISRCKSYHYEKDGKTFHRSQFQRWKLKQLFPQYDSMCTEKEIMQKEGYTRVNEIQATWVLRDSKFYIYEIELNGYHYIGQHMGQPGDGYTGSGTILRRMQKKYNTKGNMTVLLKDIESQSDADKYEICAIYCNKLVYGDLNINIKSGGQGYQSTDKIHTPNPERNAKISKAMKGRCVKESTKREISETLKARAKLYPMEEEKRQYYSELLSIRNSKRTQEDFDKISKGVKESYAKNGPHSKESYKRAAESRKKYFAEHPEARIRGKEMSDLVKKAKAEMSKAFKLREDKSITWNQFQREWKEKRAV